MGHELQLATIKYSAEVTNPSHAKKRKVKPKASAVEGLFDY
ncbi:MAG: hypothetical protein ACTS4X_01225 [Candidatus Hodgkinia cicadicola]